MAAPDASPLQTAAAPQRPISKTQPPRFNYRTTTNFEAYQVSNIAALKKILGTTDNHVLRTAIDVLAYLNGLPVETDPSFFLGNFLHHNGFVTNNGGQNGRS